MHLLLLFLALLGTAQAKTPTVPVARGTDTLISWSYPALENFEVAQNYSGTVRLNGKRTLPARVMLNRATSSGDGLIALEGKVVYGKDCTMQLHASLRVGPPNLSAGPPKDERWLETLERCPGQVVAPYRPSHPPGYGSLLIGAPQSGFTTNYLQSFRLLLSAKDGAWRELDLKASGSNALKVQVAK